ncbi:hypothetical protein [Moraxella bovoculi]|uniref:hypothetical protein n=1 Tax=Moraxella bovoculi TaxID=386891 RepID=UPI001314BDEE|nr:hypothetical protein [Moraxella bovoculi]
MGWFLGMKMRCDAMRCDAMRCDAISMTGLMGIVNTLLQQMIKIVSCIFYYKSSAKY